MTLEHSLELRPCDIPHSFIEVFADHYHMIRLCKKIRMQIIFGGKRVVVVNADDADSFCLIRSAILQLQYEIAGVTVGIAADPVYRLKICDLFLQLWRIEGCGSIIVNLLFSNFGDVQPLDILHEHAADFFAVLHDCYGFCLCNNPLYAEELCYFIHCNVS